MANTAPPPGPGTLRGAAALAVAARNKQAVMAAAAEVAQSRWSLVARPNQLPPPGDWFIWLICCGRGWGKTRTAAEFVREKMNSGAWQRAAFVGATESDYRDTMIQGPSGLLACHRYDPKGKRPRYMPSAKQVVYPSGAVILLYSAEKAERVHGPNLDGVWMDELGVYPTRTIYDEIMLALRGGGGTGVPQCVISTTPEQNKADALDLLEDLFARVGQDVVLTQGHTEENRAHLAKMYLQHVIAPLRKTRMGRAKLSGDISVLLEKEGALWNADLLDATRTTVDAALPRITRIAVALDPGTSTQGASAGETGIMVVGADPNGHFYVLEDLSGKYSPEEWARTAVEAAGRWEANLLVAEANQGGDMVASTIRQIPGAPPVTLVRASHGKVARAEPVSLLFQEGRGHLCGLFDRLEKQMVTFVPFEVRTSPDRLDAMVWGAYAVCRLAPAGKMLPPGVVVTSSAKSGWTRAAARSRRGTAAHAGAGSDHSVSMLPGLLGTLRK